MLDAYIIDEIKRQEEEKRRKEEQDRPRIDPPPPAPPSNEEIPKKPDADADRGVVIINPDGTESTR